MGDLQCAARFLLTREADVTGDLAEMLAGERIAHVYAGPGLAETRAARVAGLLGTGTTTRDELGRAVGLDALVEELADVHRGESVLLVAHADAMARLPESAIVEVLSDSDGEVISAWATTSPDSG